MPTSRVQAPDGQVISVEHPEGASPDQIISFAQQQAPRQRIGSIEVARPGEKVGDFPSPSAYLGRAIKERSGDILSTVATAAVPGGRVLSGLPGFAARLFAAEGGKDVGDLIAGNKVTPGLGAASQLVGEGVAKVVGPMLSAIPFRRFAADTASKLADALKERVPAWASLPSNEKGLYEMAHGVGQRTLSQGYETALRGVKGQIPTGHAITLPPEDARALGLTGAQAPVVPWAAYQARRAGVPPPQAGVVVDMRDVIEALPEARKGDMSLYRRALRAVDQGLESIQEGLGDAFMAERSAYRTGAGFMDFAERGKFLHGERFNPAVAQAALDKAGKRALLSRGLDDVRDIVRGPGDNPIVAEKHGPWTRRIQGATLGELLGFPFGVHGPGAVVGGALGERLLPATTYRNVPLDPLTAWAARLSRPGIAEAAREAGQQLNVQGLYP